MRQRNGGRRTTCCRHHPFSDNSRSTILVIWLGHPIGRNKIPVANATASEDDHKESDKEDNQQGDESHDGRLSKAFRGAAVVDTTFKIAVSLKDRNTSYVNRWHATRPQQARWCCCPCGQHRERKRPFCSCWEHRLLRRDFYFPMTKAMTTDELFCSSGGMNQRQFFS